MAKSWRVTSLVALALLGCLVGTQVGAQDSVWSASSMTKGAPPPQAPQVRQPPAPQRVYEPRPQVSPPQPQYSQAPKAQPPPPPQKAYEPRPQVSPPQPQVYDPRPQVSPPQPQVYEPRPQVSPPQPQYSQVPKVQHPPPPQRDYEPRPQVSPPQPQYSQVPKGQPPPPPQKAYEPRPQVSPPRPQVYEPRPQVSPPQPQYSQVPKVQPPPPPQKVYEPRPQVSPPRPQVYEPRPQVSPPRPQVYEPRPQVLPPQPQYSQAPKGQPPPPQAHDPRPQVSPPRPQVYEPRPQVSPPQPQYSQAPKVQPPPSPPKFYEPRPQVLPPRPQYSQGPKHFPYPRAFTDFQSPQEPQAPQPQQPPQPYEPYQPEQPHQPYQPYQPEQPHQPYQPNKPEQPHQPYQPTKPQQPHQPYQPTKPQQPHQPYQPTKPQQPHQPYQPTKPQQPHQPYQPTKPQQPHQPYEPYQPQQPHQPYQPQQPHQPTSPQAPSKHQPSFQSCEVAENQKVPCGGPDITAATCEAISCCFDGRQCYFGKAVTVQCTKDAQFIVVVARDATLPNIDLESISLLGQGQGCTHVDSNSAFAIYQFPVTACGSVVMEEPGVIIYENRMVSSYEVGVGPLGAITRDSHFELLFQSRYIGTSIETVVVEVLPLDNPPLPVAALGPIRVYMRLANGQCNTKGCNEVEVAYSSFYTDADYPVTKVLRDPVYVEVQLLEKTDPNLVLTLGRCWTTTSSNPHSLPQWDILIDGCPYRDDRYLSSLVPVGLSSGLGFPSHYRRFIFKMFTFVDTNSMEPMKEQVYIHCSTAVCTAAAGHSCEPSCYRRKRDVKDVDQKKAEPKVVVSSGPVIMSSPQQ
ncbi:uncharacterized protein LOC126407500 isoform X31 [Epinephelus moara]|uniref:uncharacterized protein LOC126407500 isoform X31 n=1 Tax=Epinephelus moara TaxID=300413 RepID=UPI00214E44B4|nr:uncharacterized protein LOC126407500 isoform X31 [Epinephelus moara]